MRLSCRLVGLVLLAAVAEDAAAQCDSDNDTATLPPQFVDHLVVPYWDRALGIEFDGAGRLYVWEKGGRVWTVENGVKAATPLIDISAEVGNWGDHGLLGFALDPDYATNGYVYLLYVVDRHHLFNVGTPSYDPAVSEDFANTIGRLTRYQVDTADFASLVPGSREVLIGRSPSSGVPACRTGHGVGSLAFGEDGTLFVSTGDGGEGNGIGATTCLEDGLIRPAEEVSGHRAQLVDSLNGKILRIDPATGMGVPGNPFYSGGAPFSARSRVWTLGARNPFRMIVRPRSGSENVFDVDPGTLIVGDVGAGHWEELHVVAGPGENLGHPIFHGMDRVLFGAGEPNLDAPNPLFGMAVPGVGPCTEAYFSFEDLIVQDTLNAPSWPNPCDPSQEVADPVWTWMHLRPAVAWSHFSQFDSAVAPDYLGDGEAATIPIDDPGSPIVSDQFYGNCSVGGTWYTHSTFPAEYLDTYFHADYIGGWIRSFRFDDDEVVEILDFAEAAGQVVALAVDPLSGDLYYINYKDDGFSSVRRIAYEPFDLAPTAVARATPRFGYAPLRVEFDCAQSSDPEGAPLKYRWTFGDGTPESVLASPRRVYPSEDVTALGTIVCKLDELDPPVPMGMGSLDKEVIRDGVWPQVGTGDLTQQFDTTHLEEVPPFPLPLPVQKYNPETGLFEDWIGYTFAEPRELTGLVFQEGVNINTLGGYFDTLVVQVRDATSGEWNDVTSLVSDPAYPGSTGPGGLPNTNYERFELGFDPVVGDGIRLFGDPGGSFGYVSVGELRVLATPAVPPVGPVNFTAELTVTDVAGASDCSEVTISLNNTPPTTHILRRSLGEALTQDQVHVLDLLVELDDLEHGAAALDCQWQVILRHNVHTHPEPPIAACQTMAAFPPHALLPGDFLYYEARFTATDPLGLATTESHYLFLDGDCNLNGVDDAAELAAGASFDLDGDGVPDECQTDCNLNGTADVIDIALGDSADVDADRVPDECGILLHSPSQPLPDPPEPPARAAGL